MSPTAGVLSLARVLGAQAPTPPPTPEDLTIYNVTPGISGFIAFFVLAIAGWLLFRSLVRHVRKVDMAGAQREREVQEREAAERAELETTDAPADEEIVDDAPAGGASTSDERRDQAAE